MTEPQRNTPWGALLLAASLVLMMIGLLAALGGVRGALAGAAAAVLVFTFLLAVIWRAGLLGERKALPLTPSLVVALFLGMLLVLLLAVLVFVIK